MYIIQVTKNHKVVGFVSDFETSPTFCRDDAWKFATKQEAFKVSDKILRTALCNDLRSGRHSNWYNTSVIEA